MSGEKTICQKAYGDIAPALADYSDSVLFGDVWERDALSKRDRSLITVADNAIPILRKVVQDAEPCRANTPNS